MTQTPDFVVAQWVLALSSAIIIFLLGVVITRQGKNAVAIASIGTSLGDLKEKHKEHTESDTSHFTGIYAELRAQAKELGEVRRLL